MIQIVVNDQGVADVLRRAHQAAADPEPILRAAGTTLLSITLGNFSVHGAAYRPKPWPPKRDGSPATLKKSGTLSSSFHLRVTPQEAVLSNPMPYAAIHQFGGKTPPHTIRPRLARALRFQVRDTTVFAARVEHPGSNIPARPFVPITEAGEFTAAASSLIVAAAERALRRQLGV
ncbi:MAG: phage virion morphogenesis protein [Verrucomicrobiae bacterium]|nr:phage virion morphogenesis protein [Verrucomicrobiae bacterium]MDW8309202.1 phage virion morphogenesis protein [Verrucomicrobiales bacterium]